MICAIGRAVLVAGTLLIAATASAQDTEAPAAETTDTVAGGDVVVARVGQIEILLTEVIGEIYSLSEEERSKQPFDEMYDDYLQRRIDRAMIFQAAVAAGLRDDPQHAKRMVQIERRVLSDQFVQNVIRGQVRPSDMKARYDAFVESESKRREMRARYILAKDEAHAIELRARFDAGEDFEDVARSLDYPAASRGGDLGYFNEQTMVPEVVAAAKSLEIGAISQPFQSQFGWHLIKLEDRRAVRVREFDEVRDQLVEEASKEVVENLVTDLRANFPIERFNRDGTPVEDAPESESSAEPADH
ncbi:MAG: peptidylprolyl isomerase [Alphaproteobacteria bacterium]